MRRQVYVIPNMITTFSLACGLFVIFKANMLEAGKEPYQALYTSVLLLIVASIADVIDGAVARVIRAESEFGAIFDSLADAVSFGVAPSVLFLKSLSLEQGSTLSFIAIIAALIFSICGVLRLVRFNVKSAQAKGNIEEETAQKKNFTGLPIPAGALASVSLNLFLSSPFAIEHLGKETASILLMVSMPILGFFMISRWKFPSLKVLHFRVPSFYLVLVAVILASFVLYGFLHFFPIMLLALSWGYVVLGWVLSLIRLVAGKKSKTLADFEPEEEDNE